MSTRTQDNLGNHMFTKDELEGELIAALEVIEAQLDITLEIEQTDKGILIKIKE